MDLSQQMKPRGAAVPHKPAKRIAPGRGGLPSFAEGTPARPADDSACPGRANRVSSGPVATRKRRGASIDLDLDKQPYRRETAKRRFGAGFKRWNALVRRAPRGRVFGLFRSQGAWPCLLRKQSRRRAPFLSPRANGNRNGERKENKT